MLAACATPAPLPEPMPAPMVVRPPVTPCVPRADALGRLAERYGETPVALGVTNTGGLVEVLTTESGSTWTIIVTLTNGTSCMVAAGEGWRDLERKPVGEGT